MGRSRRQSIDGHGASYLAQCDFHGPVTERSSRSHLGRSAWAECIALKGDSYRLRKRDLGSIPQPEPPANSTAGGKPHMPDRRQTSPAVEKPPQT
jgi:hypothetical protein